MKKSQEILGLPVFSIIDGREIGQVKDLIVNPEEGAVEFLLVDSEEWYTGAKVLPFKAVSGLGEHAVTTESEDELIGLGDHEGARTLLKRGIKVIGNRVLTRQGNFIGSVIEYAVDDNTGNIQQVEWSDGDSGSGLIPGDKVLTFGKDVLVINERFASGDPGGKGNQPLVQPPLSQPQAPEPVADVSQPIPVPEPPAAVSQPAPVSEPAAPTAPVAEQPPVVDAPVVKPAEPEEKKGGTQLFVERQKQFLTGKYLTRDILDKDGSVIAAVGTQLTPGLLNVLEIKGKLMEVSQNVR